MMDDNGPSPHELLVVLLVGAALTVPALTAGICYSLPGFILGVMIFVSAGYMLTVHAFGVLWSMVKTRLRS